MKKRNVVSLFVSAAILTVFAACGSAQTADGEGATRGGSVALRAANRALSEISYSPNMRGWEYKATAVPAGEFDTWATRYKAQIEDALNQVGDGYKLQVTGHTCSIGPREAQADGRRGNVYYSEQRARNVYTALERQGIPTDRMTFKGVADDQPRSGVGSDDRTNRRVSFQLVPAE